MHKISTSGKSYKSNSPYLEAIGLRPKDKLSPIILEGEAPFYPDVYRYDRDIYPDINYFFEKYNYMYRLYKEFHIKNHHASIKDFLEADAGQDIFDTFYEISFKYKNYRIHYSWGKIKKVVRIHGIFRINEYFFFPTSEYLFLQNPDNGKAYIYQGEMF